MVYQWKMEKLYPVDAQSAGEELERIESKRNEVTAKNVVAESKPKDAVLHPCFDWNDKTAAERWREYQARKMICALVTVHVQPNQSNEKCGSASVVRAFVNVSDGYKPLPTVLRVSKYKDEMLADAKRDMQAFEDKYHSLEELSEVFSAMHEVNGLEVE